MAKQREQYRFYHAGRHSFLTEERIDLLKSLGFVWRVKGKGKETLEEQYDNEDYDHEEEEEDSAPKKKSKRNRKTEEVEKDEIASDHGNEANDTDVGLQPDALRHDMEVSTADDIDLDMKMAPVLQNMQHRISDIPPTGNMNGMGLLASVTNRMNGPASVPAGAMGHVPAFPSLPDQQRFFAQQQHAARATMASLAAQANQHQVS